MSSCENSTDRIWPAVQRSVFEEWERSWKSGRSDLLATDKIPQACCPVGTAGGQQPPCMAEGHSVRRSRMSESEELFKFSRGIPDPDGRAYAASRQRSAVRAEADGPHIILVNEAF